MSAMISEHEKVAKTAVAFYKEQEDKYRHLRQEAEDTLRQIMQLRGVQRLEAGCPPAFILDCVLEDGTTCPFYHEGHCTKATEEADQQ